MLVITRSFKQTCVITVPPSDTATRIKVGVYSAHSGVRLGFDAPDEVVIHRDKIQDQVDKERAR